MVHFNQAKFRGCSLSIKLLRFYKHNRSFLSGYFVLKANPNMLNIFRRFFFKEISLLVHIFRF